MMLDATAGNRMNWGRYRSKYPQNVVFMDKEMKLYKPPNLFADFRFLPFRADVFDCVLFDPPHSFSIPPWWADPSGTKHDEWAKTPKSRRSWYGKFKNKREMFSSINKAQKEFARVGRRLCLKWSELEVTLWKILAFFTEWEHIRTKPHKGKYSFGKTKTYWVTFVNSQFKEDSDP